jgi:dTDP-4-dehydrorhamnose 3,5-epimerase
MLGADKVSLRSLDILTAKEGDVLKGMLLNSSMCDGEMYFSTIKPNAVKAWKCHQVASLNLFVPAGLVRFVTMESGEFQTYLLGRSSPYHGRLFIPPGIWFGFEGLSSDESVIVSLSNMRHDGSEVLRKEIDDLSFDWKG